MTTLNKRVYTLFNFPAEKPTRTVGDLKPFKGILPYASQIFGVYQPLLGWKSQRAARRFQNGYHLDRASLYCDALMDFDTNITIQIDDNTAHVDPIKPGQYSSVKNPIFNSTLIHELARQLPSDYDEQVWN